MPPEINHDENRNIEKLIQCFFKYYVYHHVHIKDGNNYPEFSDGLVVFDDFNLVFEMKTRKGDIARYNEGYDAGIEQLKKAFSRIQSGQIDLRIGQDKNAPKLDIRLGKKTFYILLMHGMSDDYNDIENAMNDDKGNNCYERFLLNIPQTNLSPLVINKNLFIYNSEEAFDKTLKHCSTIKDYINFLEFTSEMHHNDGKCKITRKIILPHDEVLLYLFLNNNRMGTNIVNNLKEYDYINFNDDVNLSDQTIKNRINEEWDSHQIIDKGLIEFLINQNISEEIIRDYVRLERSGRYKLAKAIQERRTVFIIPKECHDILYCVDYGYDDYGNFTIEEYIEEILIKKLPNITSISILLYHSINGFYNRTLVKIDDKSITII